MTVYFANDGKIDLDVIRIMGVSVKCSDNPIGYFGTGLKFALATLLRTGHEVTLSVGNDQYDFRTSKKDIRGETFDCIYMNDEQLPFTTQLGRNWEVWQAYRELHSNTLDESGTITDQFVSADTVISVRGEAIQKEYQQRHLTFLQHEPIHSAGCIEVHPGETKFVYYRGVRAGALPVPTKYTYNLISQTELSEDRTIKSQFEVEWRLQNDLPLVKDVAFQLSLLEGSDFFDQCLDFSMCHNPAREFLDAVEQVKNNASVNASAKRMLEKHRQTVQVYEPCSLSDAEAQRLIDAKDFLRILDCTIDLEKVTVTETLGPDVYGLYHRTQDRIFLSRQVLDNGLTFVANTLYEEWVHMEHGLKDETRALQQFLFDRLIATAEKLAA